MWTSVLALSGPWRRRRQRLMNYSVSRGWKETPDEFIEVSALFDPAYTVHRAFQSIPVPPRYRCWILKKFVSLNLVLLLHLNLKWENVKRILKNHLYFPIMLFVGHNTRAWQKEVDSQQLYFYEIYRFFLQRFFQIIYFNYKSTGILVQK